MSQEPEPGRGNTKDKKKSHQGWVITKIIRLYSALLPVIAFIRCADLLYSELPGTVMLYSPDAIYATAAAVRWNKASSENFAAYKIYFDSQPKITDSSTLATSIIYKNDTTFLLSGLDENTTYYVKVFVHNSTYFSESNEISFTTIPCTCGSFTGEKQDGMILIPAGCYIGKDNTRATISYDFYMDTTEVTVAEWNTTMTSASIIDTSEIPLAKWQTLLKIDTSNSLKPVTEISWYQMMIYCNEKSKKTNRDTCYLYTAITIDTLRYKISELADLECDFSKNGFRLPTEDEWEYACRAGRSEEFFWGKEGNTLIEYPYTTSYPITLEDSLEISEYVWWGYNNVPEGAKEVGQKKPNAWHLYDIVGNVTEAVWDISSGEERPENRIDYTGSKPGPQSVRRAIIRGSSFQSSKAYALTVWWRRFSIEFNNVDNAGAGFRTIRTNVP